MVVSERDGERGQDGSLPERDLVEHADLPVAQAPGSDQRIRIPERGVSDAVDPASVSSQRTNPATHEA